jgi:hypothetical protein
MLTTCTTLTYRLEQGPVTYLKFASLKVSFEPSPYIHDTEERI